MPRASANSRRTFLFTDIESSTRLWDQYPDAMLAALDQHDAMLAHAVADAGGQVIRHTGDGIVSVFPAPGPAVEAALSAQRGLVTADWRAVEPIRVRMGVHTGDVVLRGDEYHGWALNFASRLHALAHGGQIVVSGSAMADLDTAQFPGVEFTDLGLHRLRDVAEPIRVYSVTADGITGHFDGLRSSERKVPAIPRPLTSFVGRVREVEQVVAELRGRQVVTLAGVGGVGKTRLSLEVARRLAPEFADGVAMCELSGVAPEQVGAALANALGVERRTARSAEESVVEWLVDKRLLAVLDAGEEAADAVRLLVHRIASTSPGCTLLITGHEPLSVAGEHVVRVQPLEIGDEHSDGVELFLQRARAAGADIGDDPRTRRLAREVCEAVAGLPLAIELAASNAGSLSLRDIVDAVHAGELPGVHATGHGTRSVADALELTMARLDAATRTALQRCSVFSGSFDRAAFTAVGAPEHDGGQVLALLRTLADRSLVTSETRRERTRFRLLEPVRAHLERTAPAETLAAARAAFLAHYVDTAEAASDALRGPDEAKWVSQIELDFDNLRAAHRRGLSIDGADSSIRIVASLWDFAFMRMRSEIFDWGEAAAAASADHPLRAMVLGVVALGGWLRENPAKAVEFATESMRLEHETGATRSAPARMALMNSAEYGGTAVDVRSLMAELTEVTAESDSPYWHVNADVLRVLSHSFAGRAPQALEKADVAMATARRSDNPSTIAWALFAKGMATELVEADHAEALFEDGLDRARSVDNGWISAMCSTRLASLRRRRGSWPDAMTMVEELLDIWGRAGHRSHLWGAVRQAALCLVEAGDHANGLLLYEAATLPALAAPRLPVEAAADDDCLDRARAALGDGVWQRVTARAVGLDQASAVQRAADAMRAALAALGDA